jgi:hypothetical protein
VLRTTGHLAVFLDLDERGDKLPQNKYGSRKPCQRRRPKVPQGPASFVLEVCAGFR